MKTKLLFTVCYSIFVLTVSAQDTLKVNFKKAGTPGAEGWDSILVPDKGAYSDGYKSISAFGGTVNVMPMWLNSPVDANTRAIDRGSSTHLSQYQGSMKDVLRSYTAVDSRHTEDCNIIAITISGLPAGTYTYISYHHDFNDQFGSFTITTTKNSSQIDADLIGKMISHSLDLESFNSTYTDDALVDPEATEYKAHYVKHTLDSVTTYSYNQIESSGESDIFLVSYKNILEPAADMSEHKKFVLINGFKLFLSPNGIENKQNTQNINIVNRDNGNVFITGKELSDVIIYSIDGKLIKHVISVDNQVELTNMQQGIYIAKVGFNNGKTISRKIVVR